jgi:competence protein ComEC
MVIAPFLWQRKILTIDYLVLSHPQADHMNGLRFIAEAFHSKEFWHNGDRVETPSYKELMETLEKENALPKKPAQLQEMNINGAEIEFLLSRTREETPHPSFSGKRT